MASTLNRPQAGHATNLSSTDDLLAIDPLLSINRIGTSDQACKECSRRKARCNRVLPTCDMCAKYRRHCLYDKHSRTPLTRKHLTEVEARLEKAEALLKKMHSLVPPHLRTWEKQQVTFAASQRQLTDPSFDFSNFVSVGSAEVAEAVQGRGEPAQTAMPTSLNNVAHVPLRREIHDHDHHQRTLEVPPVEDFEWSEDDALRSHDVLVEMESNGVVDDSHLADGMAALTVNEHDSGYLGVASGAALLRLLEPQSSQRRTSPRLKSDTYLAASSPSSQPNINQHITDTMIDSFFHHFHVSYPIVHEPTFRAQYGEVIARPNGPCWTALAYVVAAIGAWILSPSSSDALHTTLFSHARSILGLDFLEVGNLSVLQALMLTSNYQQKCNKPNSGYSYLGLSDRMAMSLGLHKEFQGWNISPLKMEMRRRVWWCLCCFDSGASITYGRPDVWPHWGVEVAYPLNINDKDLTAASRTYPPESDQMTPYTAVATQARFHMATHECYEKVVSQPFPDAQELLRLETSRIETWRASVPLCFANETEVPRRFALPQAIMRWRERNLRIIMYRPFVIRRTSRRKPDDTEEASYLAYKKCLADAKATIEEIRDFWHENDRNRLAAWYALFYLFQAALIPCICLRHDSSAAEAADWRQQIQTTLDVVALMSPFNASSWRRHRIISDLCGGYMNPAQPEGVTSPGWPVPPLQPFTGHVGSQLEGEGTEAQLDSVLNTTWLGVPPIEAADVMVEDEAGWMEFLRLADEDFWA